MNQFVAAQPTIHAKYSMDHSMRSETPVQQSVPAWRPSHWNQLHSVRFQRYTPTIGHIFFYLRWWVSRPVNCACSDAEQILEANPIEFDSAETLFHSGIRLHNAVNAKLAEQHPALYYEQVSEEEANYLWRGIYPQRSKRAVVIVALTTVQKAKLKEFDVTQYTGADVLRITNRFNEDIDQEMRRIRRIESFYDVVEHVIL